MASIRPPQPPPDWTQQRMVEMDIDHNPPLNTTYRCYSSTFTKDLLITADQAARLEAGDKIIMPPSALGVLAPLNLPIMLFQLKNHSKIDNEELVSHCGVLEFNAEEGTIYMPSWKMKSLQLEDGDEVHVKVAFLPKGRFVKLRPHSMSFVNDITNPRAVLEKTLRTFTCFTKGDTIMLMYNEKEYYVDIVETNPPLGISIIDTDCEVDFVAPLDYKEPEKPCNVSSKAAVVATSGPVEETKVGYFSGAGRRLDGKPALPTLEPLPAPPVCTSSAVGPSGNGDKQPASDGRRANGKLVFGGSNNATSGSGVQKEVEKKGLKEEAKPEKKEEPKFQPFSGKAYSLKG